MSLYNVKGASGSLPLSSPLCGYMRRNCSQFTHTPARATTESESAFEPWSDEFLSF